MTKFEDWIDFQVARLLHKFHQSPQLSANTNVWHYKRYWAERYLVRWLQQIEISAKKIISIWAPEGLRRIFFGPNLFYRTRWDINVARFCISGTPYCCFSDEFWLTDNFSTSNIFKTHPTTPYLSVLKRGPFSVLVEAIENCKKICLFLLINIRHRRFWAEIPIISDFARNAKACQQISPILDSVDPIT